MQDYRWLHFAILSAICAASVGIFGKIGMKEIDPDLSTALRSIVQAGFVLVFITFLGVWPKIQSLAGRPKAMVMILLSGVAGGLSWIFYFRALKVGTFSQVSPIDKLSMPLGILLAVVVLRERPSLVNWLGIFLIAGGAYLATWKTAKPAVPEVPVATSQP
jgi:transporter family protein